MEGLFPPGKEVRSDMNEIKAGPENSFPVIDGKDLIFLPRSSNKSWLTLFYALPKELVEKQPEYLKLPRSPYEVLRTDKYDSLINDDLFLQLVWDCYAWSILQFIPVPKKDGTYRALPGTEHYYSGDFPLWRLSYHMVSLMREKFEVVNMGFQKLYGYTQNMLIPYTSYEKFSDLIRILTAEIIAKQNYQPWIDEIWRTKVPEDYSEYYSRLKNSFMGQWYHARTKAGSDLSLEGLKGQAVYGDAAYDLSDNGRMENEVLTGILKEQFLQTLSETDRRILKLKSEGKTTEEIAPLVGYKTHSAVVKRQKKIRSQFDDFVKDSYEEYRETFEAE